MTATGESIPVIALDGRDTLGFLAGLGLLRILGADHRLSWDVSTGQARVTGPVQNLSELVETTVAAVAAMPDDELSPGLPDRLIPQKVGSAGADPARIELSDLHGLIDAEEASDALRWIGALWTDLADDNDGRCARTPFNAPAGQQTLRSMFTNAYELVSKDPHRWLGEALSAWTRVPGHTGEGLESRALRDASELVDSKKPAYGVPGATFLALAALPFFRLSGNGVLAKGNAKDRWRSQRTTTCWYRVPDGRRTRSVFAWPLWSPALDQASIPVLLEHPAVAQAVSRRLRPDATRGGAGREDAALRALGVWATPVASRRQAAGGKSEGYLTVERVERY